MKHIDVAEFRRLGYLQEVNRRLLHPLGLALAVGVDDDGVERLRGVWDCRDDPEGIRFDGPLDAEAADRIGHELMARGVARKRQLGYIVQPADGEAT